MAEPFFAYLLRCADGSYYVGHTDDLERRVGEHNTGESCAYTTTRRPVELIWCQEFYSRAEALAAEFQIKRWSRAKKEALARGDFNSLSLAAKKKDWDSYRQRKQQPSHAPLDTAAEKTRPTRGERK
jgi:tRNA/rRNA methyltransferase